MSDPRDTPWTPELIDKFRELWEAHGGNNALYSTAEIARRLGLSKNAVVGKAHRLRLPARPSPIIRTSYQKPTAPRRVGTRPTLPPLASVHVPTRLASPRVVTPHAPIVESTPPPEPAPRPYGRVIKCCWPVGTPGTKTFRFCEDASEPGKPYCPDHCKLAFIRIRDRREDTAA